MCRRTPEPLQKSRPQPLKVANTEKVIRLRYRLMLPLLQVWKTFSYDRIIRASSIMVGPAILLRTESYLMKKVIYLTGAPAAGKSSTTKLLIEKLPELLVWEYGARLAEHCAARSASSISQNDLRTSSASIVTPEDVVKVDQDLIEFVNAHRGRKHVLIDSHPVTKENYGYRITAFSFEQLAKLSPNEIWVLFASPEETRRRIQTDPGGRPLVSEEEARMHTTLQASVAATYGVSLHCPVYLFDTAVPRESLISRLVGRLP